MSDPREDKAFDDLKDELVELAKKYTDLLPEYEVKDSCPVDGCSISWINRPRDSKYCHLHGKRLTDLTEKPSINEVLREMISLTEYAMSERERMSNGTIR